MQLNSTAKDLGSGIAAIYRRYAEWLVSITWKRFILLSILLLIVAGIASNIPPFTWVVSERTVKSTKRTLSSRDVDIKLDEHGLRITPKRKSSQAPEIIIDEHGVQIRRKADPDTHEPAHDIIIDEHGVQMKPRGQAQPKPPTPPKPPSLPSSEEDAAASAEDQRQMTQDTGTLAQDFKREVTDQLAQEIRREVLNSLGDPGQTERIIRTHLGDFLPQL